MQKNIILLKEKFNKIKNLGYAKRLETEQLALDLHLNH